MKAPDPMRQDGAGAAEQPIGEQPEGDQGLSLSQLKPDQQGQQDGPDGQRGHDQRASPAPERPFRNPVHQQAEAGARQQESDQVEPARILLPLSRQEQDAEDHGGDPDRHVDVEHPAPGQVGNEQTANHGTQRRRQRGRHDHDAGGAHPLGRRKRPVQHGHAHRHHQPAAGALDDPEEDQLAEAAGRPAQGGCPGEQHDRDQQHPPAAETVAQPPGRRNENRQADQIGDGHGGHGVGPDVELAPDRRQGHVDDRHVHDVHEHRRHEDRADGHLLVDAFTQHG